MQLNDIFIYALRELNGFDDNAIDKAVCLANNDVVENVEEFIDFINFNIEEGKFPLIKQPFSERTIRKAIEKVKSEKYADEELSRLKSEYDKMKSDCYRGFPISEEEDKNIKEWKKNQQKKNPGIGGAAGGRFTYKFTPTGFGTAGTIIDGFTGDEFTFQELG